MQIGDLVRVRYIESDEWHAIPAVVVEEYHTWEKIVRVFHLGRRNSFQAGNIQLINRNWESPRKAKRNEK